MLMLPQDFDGIAQEKMRAWEIEVQRRQLQAQIARPRPIWRRWILRRWAGTGLMRVGRWLTQLGSGMADEIAECEGNPRISVASEA
jgi:hypothetical protein